MFVRDVSLSARRDNNTYIKDLDQSDSDSAGSAWLCVMFSIDDICVLYDASLPARPSWVHLFAYEMYHDFEVSLPALRMNKYQWACQPW